MFPAHNSYLLRWKQVRDELLQQRAVGLFFLGVGLKLFKKQDIKHERSCLITIPNNDAQVFDTLSQLRIKLRKKNGEIKS